MERKAQPEAASKLTLPALVAGPVDVARLIRELEMIDDSLLQLGLRTGGSPTKMPKTGYLLEKTVQLNKLNLLRKTDRAALRRYLTAVHDKAPVMHISFGSEPSPLFVEKLMTWLRREIYPEALLTIGLQPTLGAGCILRTTNKYFDLSLRQTFTKKRDLLMTELFGKATA